MTPTKRKAGMGSPVSGSPGQSTSICSPGSGDMHGCAALLPILLDVMAGLGIHEWLVTRLAAFLQVFCPEELFVDSITKQFLLNVVEVRHPLC